MKKSLKKALALLLCLVLCFSMLPLGAWATEEASEEADTPEETVSEDEVSEADIEPPKFEAEEDNIEETSETAVEAADAVSEEPVMVTIVCLQTNDLRELVVCAEGSSTPIAPCSKVIEEDTIVLYGTYLLFPGEYTYSLTGVDGYDDINGEKFTVDHNTETVFVELSEAEENSPIEFVTIDEAGVEFLATSGKGPVGTDANGYECAIWPIQYVNIIQGRFGSYSHNGQKGLTQNAIDVYTYTSDSFSAHNSSVNIYAPFTGRIYTYKSSGFSSVNFVSENKVHFADGTIDYMTVCFGHDNNVIQSAYGSGTDCYNANGTTIKSGTLIRQGEVLCHEGTYYGYDSHTHVFVFKGKNPSSCWGGDVNKEPQKQNLVNIENALFVDKEWTKFYGSSVYQWVDLSTSTGSTSTGYLSKCTAFPSYVKVKTTGTTTLKSLPCSNKTDSTSTDIATLGSGVTLTCTGLLLNDQGNYWYKVYSNDSAGMCYNTDCYVYAGNVTYTSKVSTSNYGAYVTGTNKPTTITVFDPYPVTGYIKSSYNNITSGGVQVYSGSNVTTGTAKTGLIKTGLNTKSFGLAGEVDKATVYNSLSAGAYTYVVSATLQGYYATSATEKTSYTISNVVLEKTNFSITSPSHTHSYSTTIVAPTCTEAGYTAHSCSCGYSYTDTATSPKGHTYAYSMTKEPTISATGTITRICSNCSDSLAITMPSLNKTDYSYTVSGTTEKYIYTYLGNTFTVNKTLATYTISYNANGGSGAPASQTKIAGNALSLSSTVPVKAGNTFLGWATTSSATTPTYLAGSTYSTDKTVTLYAVWTTASCAIDTVWSDWSTTNPTNVAEGLKESKVQYRYRTRRETTSSEDTLDGWIKFDSVTLWSDYGEWTSWSGTAVTASDSREVESKVIYRYYCYICPTCGSRNAYNNSGCSHISNSNRGSWCETWSSIAYNQSTYTNLDSAKSYTTALGDGNKWYFSRGNVNNTTVGTVDSASSAIVIKTGYRYRERTSEIVNSFYQYTAWSDWLDEALDVNKYPYQESRILYRYATQTVNEHNWKSGTVTTASSCITGGVKTYTCTLCGATKTEAIAALGHSYTTAVTAPTCTAQGYTKHTCSRCSDVFVDNYTSAIGHSITLQNLKNASCEEAGYTGDSVCTVCGTVTTFGATVSALGHSYGEGIVTKKATTTAQGEITYTCSRCSKTYIEYTPLLTEDDGNTATAQLVLNVSSITVQPGQDIEIPVTVNSNPGIAMLLFTVDYDETVLALTDCTSTALTDLFGNTATGKYCWVNGNNVTATGTIFTLHFKVSEAAASGTETAVRLVERMAANISETELTTAIVRGTVTVSNRTPGDVTGDGTVNGMDLLRLKKYLVGFDVEINTSNADVTGDGNVDGLDLLRLKKYLVGNDVTLQ